MNNHRVPLEICLSSNLQTGVVADISKHPLRYYLDLGLRVTLNTDNTLFARTSITQELVLAVRTFDLTLLETENMLLNGFKSAFLPERRKAKLVGEALETFTSLRDKFALDEVRLWAETSTLSNARTMTFEFNITQRYLMVFTDRNMEVFRNGVKQVDVPA